MYVLLSPAKKLTTPSRSLQLSNPRFEEQTSSLVAIMRDKSPADLQALMGISSNLALLNVERFQDMGRDDAGSAPSAAVLTFAGDTYQGLDAASLSDKTLTYAQKHLGILSGLYGLLDPLDAIEPYRLEMGTKLHTHKGKSLYDFWGKDIAGAVNDRVSSNGDSCVVNLASKEYFSAVPKAHLDVPVVSPVFKDVRKGVAKVISFLAKRARGNMARYILTQQLKDPAELRHYAENGYRFDSDLSTAHAPVFVRQEGVTT